MRAYICPLLPPTRPRPRCGEPCPTYEIPDYSEGPARRYDLRPRGQTAHARPESPLTIETRLNCEDRDGSNESPDAPC